MAKVITRRRLTVHLYYLFALLAMPTIYAQPASQPFTDVISAPMATIKSGSIVRLDITIKSNSSELMILKSNRIGPKEAGISIWDSDGNQLPPRDEFKSYFTLSNPGMMFEPGKSLTESVNLNMWFDLTTPGRYTVQAKKRIPASKSVVESNKLTFTIIP